MKPAESGLIDPSTTHLIQRLQEDLNCPQGYTWQGDTLRYKSCLVLTPTSALKPRILIEMHSSSLVGHSRFHKTYALARCSFFWVGMKKDILTFVSKCNIYQHKKGETMEPLVALYSLPIPTSIWTDISMDFIVILPKASNKSGIVVVVDRLSKYTHFYALQHPLTPSRVTQIFINQIFKLHGVPTYIVYGCDPTFTSTFWQ